ncbi:hypothetical protein B5F34_16805 [Mediterranea sp. An20]|uniref:hypothetical protein n=1 Tax=Mediterranea sp. An20 TaxID=1965586 RepID=UPI000B3702B9|nr:hypothetical protein [Mediterranea sp. An20]OUP05531.1 hypothetical protein B5F34_16805 [Mediterranea sp. An20]
MEYRDGFKEMPFEKPKNATGYHIDAKCCHASAKRSDYAGLSFSLQHGRLEQTLRFRWITPLPTTCCHKLPPDRKAIVLYKQRLYFAGKKKNKQ